METNLQNLPARYQTVSHRMMRLCREILHFHRDHYRIYEPDDKPRVQLWRNHVPACNHKQFDQLNVRVLEMFEELISNHRDSFMYNAMFWFTEEHFQPCMNNDVAIPIAFFQAGVEFHRKKDATENGFFDSMANAMVDFEILLDEHEREWPDQLILLRLSA